MEGAKLSSESSTDELRTFLAEHIAGYEELELLVWFASEPQPTQAHTVEQAAGAFSIPMPAALAALESLVVCGLLAPGNGAYTYVYSPRNEASRASVELLLQEYARNRVRVIGLMTESSLNRLRNSALHTFVGRLRAHGPQDEEE
ncbi:MAG TPA: hypothetical protein VGM29_09430 [Polyangiaceae bacterium]